MTQEAKNVTKLLKSRENLNAVSQLKALDILIWDQDKPEVYYILSENANTSRVILCPNLLQVIHFITLRAYQRKGGYSHVEDDNIRRLCVLCKQFLVFNNK